MSQLSFLALGIKKKLRCERFLDEMNRVVPWSVLCRTIQPYYPNSPQGRPAMPLLLMVKIYCLQQWYNLSDPAMEDAIYDRNSFQRFLGIDLLCDSVPDETTILNFRHLLEHHDLAKRLFAEINAYLQKQGLLMKTGTIVDATLIAAPSSTKNREQQRDPEMGSTRKGNQYYFGMKAHVGVTATGDPLVHTMEVTSASVHDSVLLEALVPREAKVIFGDKAYSSQEREEQARRAGILWAVQVKAARGRPLTGWQEWKNRLHASIRARVEFPFQVVKQLWGHTKVRYRGLHKNACQFYMLFGLANLFRVRKKLPVPA